MIVYIILIDRSYKFMTYLEALSYIHSRPKLSKKLGNDALKEMLSKLGSPEKELKFVHVAGTNGKGSVCAMTDSVLRECGYKTGLFTSPFIERFNERIKVDGEDIPDAELAEHTEKFALDKEKIYLIWTPGFTDELKEVAENAAKELGYRQIIWMKTGCVITSHGGKGAFGVVGFN